MLCQKEARFQVIIHICQPIDNKVVLSKDQVVECAILLAQLAERINDIDLTDGKLDGKVRKPAVTCPKCGKNNARRFTKCMYCGTPIVTNDPFS